MDMPLLGSSSDSGLDRPLSSTRWHHTSSIIKLHYTHVGMQAWEGDKSNSCSECYALVAHTIPHNL